MSAKEKPTVVIVVPCYNEEEVLPETSKRLKAVMDGMKERQLVKDNSCILFVNDGSRDKTWEIIAQLHDREPDTFSGITFAANRGHQNAVMAGLMEARHFADAAISIDADLQDDVEVISQMVEKYLEGAEIVYGVRKERKTDTFFKRTTAHAFYELMNAMGVKTVYDHADYRLMGADALDALSEYPETNLFLRGIVPMLGYTTDTVLYDRAERFAGESKYPLFKMINFAIDGITSCSDTPIRLVALAGMALGGVGAIWGLIALIMAIFGHGVSGTTAVIIVMMILVAILLCAMGIVGTYVGKIYMQVKGRPRYRIAARLYPEEFKEKQGDYR